MRRKKPTRWHVMLVTRNAAKPDDADNGITLLKLFEASWKPIAAIFVLVAVAISPALYKHYTYDREVDSIIAEEALQILRGNPDTDENGDISSAEKGVRNWALDVIERYSRVKFPDDAKTLL